MTCDMLILSQCALLAFGLEVPFLKHLYLQETYIDNSVKFEHVTIKHGLRHVQLFDKINDIRG